MVARRSRLIRVNSRFAQGTNTNFVYYFDSKAVDSCDEIVLISASIPRLFPNIYSPINVLTYSDGVNTYNYTVPAAQYTAVELAAALNNCPDLTVAYDEAAHRFTFQGALIYAPYTLLASSPLANYIGLSSDLPLTGGVDYVESTPQLSLSQIYLQSDLAGLHCSDTPQLSDFIPLVTHIDCSAVPYGYTINYSLVNSESNSLSWNGDLANLRRIDIQLCDCYGNTLVLPQSAFVDLIFRIYII